MKLWTVLLGLSLLQGVQSAKAQIISATEALVLPHHFGALTYGLSGYGLEFPVNTWTLSTWINHESIDPFESVILKIVGATTNEQVVWANGVVYNGVGSGINTNGFSPQMKWFWLLIGVDAQNAFGMFAKKGLSLEKKVVPLGSARPVGGDSIIKIGTEGATYTVSSYTGDIH